MTLVHSKQSAYKTIQKDLKLISLKLQTSDKKTEITPAQEWLGKLQVALKS